MANLGRRRRHFRLPCGIEHLETRSLMSVAGSLNTSFGGGLGSIAPDEGSLVAELNGKFLVVGETPLSTAINPITTSGTNVSFELQQFNADGSPDTSFGEGGKVIVPSSISIGLNIISAALAPDGKIVLVGIKGSTLNQTVYVARFDADGTLDTTFGTGGIADLTTTATQSFTASSNAIAIQSDGQVIVAGLSGDFSANAVGEGTEFAAIRLNVNGTLDTSFGTNGQVGVPFGNVLEPNGTLLSGSSASASSIAIQPNGQIVLGGNALAATTTDGTTIYPTEFAATRLNADGSIDTSFGGPSEAGKVVIPLVANPEGVVSVAAGSLALQPDGKILLAGVGLVANNEGTGGQFLLDRLNADGTIDTTFEDNGQSLLSVPSGRVGTTGDMVVQPSGEIVVSTQFFNPGNLALLRFKPDGEPDPSFTNTTVAGLVEYPQFYDISTSGTTGLTLQPDGNLLLAGTEAAGFNLPADFHGPFIVASILAPTPALDQPPADYDGSGLTNLAVYLPASGEFAYRPTNGSTDVLVPFGIPGVGQTIPAPGDYTGSGQTEIAAYLPSQGIYAYRPTSGGPDVLQSFGIPGPGQSIPVPGDYFGTGVDDVAVYLPSIGAFGIRNPAGGPDEIIPFGSAGMGQSIPAPADYFGTGQTDLAVYLPSIGAFAIRNPAGGPDQIIPFGIAGAGNSIPIPGDYDGSGKTELAVYFPKLGEFAYRPANGGPDVIEAFGAADGSIPVPGDYTGVGHDEIAVYDPNYGDFAYRPASGPDVIVSFGSAGVGASLPLAAPISANVPPSNPGTVSAMSILSSSVPGGPKASLAAHATRIASKLPAQTDLTRPTG